MTQTIETIVDRLVESGLVTTDELLKCRAFKGSIANPAALLDECVERELLTEWQSEQIQSDTVSKFFLGNFKLMRPLGAGGMGIVFDALGMNSGRHVAIKVLTAKSAKSGARFLREAQAH